MNILINFAKLVFELISNPDITILMQDKSKQLVVINTSEYESKMDIILQDKSQYVEVELNLSQHFKSKVLTWADEYLKSNDTDDIANKFITDVNRKPGNAYGLMKCHKKNSPYVLLHLDAIQLLKIYHIGSRTNSNL